MEREFKNIKNEIAEDIKTDYRNGNFLPKEYKSSTPKRPAWLEENLRRSQDSKVEELEAELSEHRRRLGLN